MKVAREIDLSEQNDARRTKQYLELKREIAQLDFMERVIDRLDDIDANITLTNTLLESLLERFK